MDPIQPQRRSVAMTIFILYCMHENNKLPALFKLHLFETDLYNVSQLKKNSKITKYSLIDLLSLFYI